MYYVLLSETTLHALYTLIAKLKLSHNFYSVHFTRLIELHAHYSGIIMRRRVSKNAVEKYHLESTRRKRSIECR